MTNYFDFSDKQQTPVWQICLTVPVGGFIWSGREWLTRTARGNLKMVDMRDYDDNMRLCPRCRRPQIWCTCDRCPGCGFVELAPFDTHAVVCCQCGQLVQVEVTPQQVICPALDSLQRMLDSIEVMRQMAAERDLIATQHDFEFAARGW